MINFALSKNTKDTKTDFMSTYKISLENIKSRGFHGTLDHEKREGNDFFTDVHLYLPYVKVDSIEDTVDYAMVSDIVREELDIPTELLESLAERIVERILRNYPHVQKVKVKIKKNKPDVSVDADYSAVTLTKEQQNNI